MREVVIAVDEDSPLTEERWLVIPFDHDAHVLPDREAPRHELDVGCWCRPVLEARHPHTLTPHRGTLVLHHSDAQRAHRGN